MLAAGISAAGLVTTAVGGFADGNGVRNVRSGRCPGCQVTGELKGKETVYRKVLEGLNGDGAM
jgi:hypothetical protein